MPTVKLGNYPPGNRSQYPQKQQLSLLLVPLKQVLRSGNLKGLDNLSQSDYINWHIKALRLGGMAPGGVKCASNALTEFRVATVSTRKERRTGIGV